MRPIARAFTNYPKDLACEVAIGAVQAFLKESPDALDEVRFVCFDAENYELYRRHLSPPP